MSAFSANRRRILSLWLPRLPIDRIKRKLSDTRAAEIFDTNGALPPRLRGRAG